MIAYTLLGVPYYNSSIVNGAQNPILIIKAPILSNRFLDPQVRPQPELNPRP